MKLKNDYILANCCNPNTDNEIIGYYSRHNIIKIHKKDCSHVKELEKARLIALEWNSVLSIEGEFKPDQDYDTLDDIDFAILKHHLDFGVDYSLVIARKLNISKDEAFQRHNKLRQYSLIERVEAAMIQYRKGIVENKWIKHRNHTYYKISLKGEQYLNFYVNNSK